MWVINSFSFIRLIVVVIILDGDDDRNWFIILYLASISQSKSRVIRIVIRDMVIIILSIFIFFKYFLCSLLYIVIEFLVYFIVVIDKIFVLSIFCWILFVC